VVVIFGGAELSAAALESYGDCVGKGFNWPMLSRFTAKREEAEEYERAWRGDCRVVRVRRGCVCAFAGLNLLGARVSGVVSAGSDG
jgi:hypothetical protein